MEQAVDELITACVAGDLPAVRRILADDPTLPRRRNSEGSTALHAACYWGAVEAAALLLDHGAEINIPTTDSFLHIHPLGFGTLGLATA